ncbi:MAG: nucleoside-triphosphatase [Chitinophagales bacterium]|nr:nucleoside-triphosphatase [Chitinophagales bacterium]
MADIVILTGSVQSGKTTWLTGWTKGRTDVSGFICPDIDNTRFLYLLDEDILMSLQTDAGAKADTIQVGRFYFLKETFDFIHAWMRKFEGLDKNYVVIDEIGKLELKGLGLEPELSIFLNLWQNSKKNQVLILVIRDSLLDSVIDKYQLNPKEIIGISDILVKNMWL